MQVSCSKKGKVIILGDIPTGFDRNPFWYRKELELKMSCSYGPGRYDINYEEKGIDYPLPYVRWTEKRNMESFQNLLFKKIIDIGYLTTHEFDFDNAKDAFDLVVSKDKSFTGIALKYDIRNKPNKSKILTSKPEKIGKINISFIELEVMPKEIYCQISQKLKKLPELVFLQIQVLHLNVLLKSLSFSFVRQMKMMSWIIKPILFLSRHVMTLMDRMF